jgi:hypothetical protein
VPTILFNNLENFRSLPTAPLRSNKGLNGCNQWFSPRSRVIHGQLRST